MCSYNGFFGYVQFQKNPLSVQCSTVYLGMFSLGIFRIKIYLSVSCSTVYLSMFSFNTCNWYQQLLEHAWFLEHFDISMRNMHGNNCNFTWVSSCITIFAATFVCLMWMWFETFLGSQTISIFIFCAIKDLKKLSANWWKHVSRFETWQATCKFSTIAMARVFVQHVDIRCRKFDTGFWLNNFFVYCL